MRCIILYFLLFLTVLISCVKDPAIPIKSKTVCGTIGWPQGNWKVKFVVTGSSIPDSANFNINGGQAQFGTVYNKTFITPTLMLSDSINFCGDKNSDVNLWVYNSDSTKYFTTKVYINDSLYNSLTSNKTFYTFGGCK